MGWLSGRQVWAAAENVCSYWGLLDSGMCSFVRWWAPRHWNSGRWLLCGDAPESSLPWVRSWIKSPLLRVWNIRIPIWILDYHPLASLEMAPCSVQSSQVSEAVSESQQWPCPTWLGTLGPITGQLPTIPPAPRIFSNHADGKEEKKREGEESEGEGTGREGKCRSHHSSKTRTWDCQENSLSRLRSQEKPCTCWFRQLRSEYSIGEEWSPQIPG